MHLSPLRLSRPSHRRRSSGRHPVGCSVGPLRLLALADRRNLVVLHVDQRLLAGVAPRTAALGLRLAVGRHVERDEEEEVRADDGHSRERREFLSGALAHVRGPREVRRREIGVRGEVDKACPLAWERNSPNL